MKLYCWMVIWGLLTAAPLAGQDVLHSGLAGPWIPQPRLLYSLDNDSFSGKRIGEDRNYTMGTALGYAHPNWSRAFWLAPNRWLLHALLGNTAAASPSVSVGGLSFGAMGFTPEDLVSTDPVRDDRPYSNIIFLESSYQLQTPQKGHVHGLAIRYGVLGTGVADYVQSLFHTIHPVRPIPEGWPNQISHRGEPTLLLRYSRERHWDLSQQPGRLLGYRERIRLDLGYRLRASYAGQLYAGWQRPNGLRLYGYVRLRPWLTAYDALLQGQFRPSVHRLRFRDLTPLVIEGMAGGGLSIPFGTQRMDLLYGFAGHSPEARYPGNTRFHFWGRFELGWTF